MQKLLKMRVFRQFIKFGVVGASSTVINWGIYLFLTRYFSTYYLFATIVAFIFAVFNSYIWNRRWTFRSSDPKRAKQFTKFLIVSAVGLGLNTLIMFLVVDKIKISDIYGLVIATAIVTLWNFTANKMWTFKS